MLQYVPNNSVGLLKRYHTFAFINKYNQNKKLIEFNTYKDISIAYGIIHKDIRVISDDIFNKLDEVLNKKNTKQEEKKMEEISIDFLKGI